MAVTFQVERRFPIPLETVFDAHLDIDSFEEWMVGCKSVEKLTEGTVDVGTAWRETRVMFNKEASEVLEVRAIERPRSITLFCDGKKGSSGRGEYHFDHIFEDDGEGGTIVRIEGSMEMGNPLFNLLGRMMKGMITKQMARDYDSLEAYLTGGTIE
jgi:carbon monoxide dehydrogenase subunit G